MGNGEGLRGRKWGRVKGWEWEMGNEEGLKGGKGLRVGKWGRVKG